MQPPSLRIASSSPPPSAATTAFEAPASGAPVESIGARPANSRLAASLVLGALGVLVAACASGDPGAAEAGGARLGDSRPGGARSADAAPVPATGDAGAALQALIGDASCERDAQCRTVAVGWKSCGGPEAYVAWSTVRSDAAAIDAAGARSTDAARRDAQQKGLLSNCQRVVDPGATCVPSTGAAATAGAATGAGTCRIRAARAGAGGAGVY